MASKETLDTLEKTADAIEETLETIERIPKVHLNGTTKKQQYIILGVTAAFSAFTSGGFIYLFNKKRFKRKYEEIAEKEIADAKKYYAVLNKKDEFSDPISTLEKYENKSEAYRSASARSPKATEEELEAPVPKDEPPVVMVQNIFTNTKVDDFDYEAELPKRKADVPYVISQDEFMQNEPEHEQVTLTYYEGDEVLVDDRDQPVPDSEATAGDFNLNKFGYGSKDRNIVYIRNERLQMDFEVVRSEGEFVKEVLGIEHSDDQRRSKRRGHKFRVGDDE